MATMMERAVVKCKTPGWFLFININMTERLMQSAIQAVDRYARRKHKKRADCVAAAGPSSLNIMTL